MMLDEVTGQCTAMIFGRGIITAQQNITFKKMIPTPGVVLCRSWLEKEPDGRKIWINGSIEDGSGGVYAVSESLFLRSKPKL